MGYLNPIEYRGLPAGTPIVKAPFRLSETPPTIRLNPPVSGQHSRQVLREFGYTEAEIDNLVETGVVRCAPADAQ